MVVRFTIFVALLMFFVNVSGEYERCKISDDEEGLCTPFRNCDLLYNIFLNQPMSTEDKALIKKRTCDRRNSLRWVCCSQKAQDSEEDGYTSDETSNKPIAPTNAHHEPIDETENAIYSMESCVTPQNEKGVCKPIQQCELLYNIVLNPPVSTANKTLLLQSICDVKMSSKVIICCPEPIPEFTTEPFESTTADPKTCTDPRGNDGDCIPINDCPKLFAILKTIPLSPKNRKFLKDSQCDLIANVPYMCCPFEEDSPTEPPNIPVLTTEPIIKVPITEVPTTVPVWLKSLMQKLPQKPNCGADAPDRIMGGSATAIDEFPWTVLLEYLKPGNVTGFHCGGSIIHKQHVLTAAHCLPANMHPVIEGLELVNIRAGEWNIETDRDCAPKQNVNEEEYCSTADTYRIAYKKVHPRYRNKSPSKHFDIALLRLTEEIKFNDFIAPICLPLDPALWTKDYTGLSFYAAGWGKTEDPTTTRSSTKLKVDVPFFEQSKCTKKYRSQSVSIIDEQICAGGVQGKDSCNGDSGGPLMFRSEAQDVPYWYLIGAVSFGPRDCGMGGWPGVYTRITSVLGFIDQNLG